MQTDSIDLLEDYAPRAAVAKALGVCDRTISRYINRPDGWPFLEIGGKQYLHLPTIRKLIETRTRQRNPRRGAK